MKAKTGVVKMIHKIKNLLKYLFKGVLRRKEEPKKSFEIQGQVGELESKLRILTCLEDKSDADPLVATIRRDLEGKSSIFELMKSYLKELEG